ncbi:MAG: DegT/DnrJ/EryC1/StrS aminotransferase family protein [Treponema sp.]|nr:DegT/DnrJ/EryC1/StrS aminotransferase family protein [Candidatus Treponema equifaecale]
MIQTFSSTIRRKEMDAVLTCMVDEKLGPGELNTKLIQSIKENIGCDGAVAFRSPAIALSYALKALDLEAGSGIMISALAPSWHLTAVKNLGYKPLIIDVDEESGLMSMESLNFGVKNGGRLILVHESMGILPDIEKIIALGLPVIEDISQSYGASFVTSEEVSSVSTEEKKSSAGKKAGLAGVYSILGMEEYDTITAGGGAVLIAPSRREWIVLKKYTDEAPETDILTDMNSALGWIQIKEFARNEQARKAIYSIFQKALLSGKNKTFNRQSDEGSTIWSFPVVLSGSFKDVKQYSSRKEIEIKMAYEKSVISLLEDEEKSNYIHAKSLFLRTVLFPLYPRLGSESTAKVAKVLGTLP